MDRYPRDVTKAAEKWTLTAMLIAACVLLVGAVFELEWLSAAVWAVATLLVGFGLRRRLLRAA